NKAHGDNFIYLKPEDQLAFVKKYNEDSVKASREDWKAPKPFFLMAKELTLLGYFNTEVGATQVLQYEAVPGAYKGCIPLKEAGQGRTWAT
ncbi:MAG: gluconate 2-dehydrogenase subunit 3 family protein, partial [Cytophagales bacterium]